jgi:seryl-tRNA synthetase
MTPSLAELPAPDSPQAVGWGVLIFFAIMGGLYYTINVWRQLSGKGDKASQPPQPLIVKEEHAYATLPQLDALARKMDDELGRERGARKKIHEEIATIQATVSSISTETEKQSNDIAEVKSDVKRANERIDSVPERTIRLLRETKGLI